MNERDPEKNELIVNYMRLRQTVGWIGTLLPIVLLAGAAFTSTARPDSMSGYYYTDMRDVFVGTLWALGVFLVAYRGYDNVDDCLTNVAGFAAIGVALFPTKPAVTRLSTHQQVVGDIHLVLAAVTLIALGLMALRFAKQTKERFARENAIYLSSGAIVLCCVLLAAVSALVPASVKGQWPWLFFFEAVAVFAFGVSWFVKGRTIQGVRAWIKTRRGGASGTPDSGTEEPPETEQTDQAA